MTDTKNDKSDQTPPGSGGKKLVILIGLAALIGLAYWQTGDLLSLENLARQETKLRSIQEEQPLLVYGAAFLIYVLVAGLSLPGAAILTLVYGWYFGFWNTLVLVSFASTLGATLAFFISRFLFRDAIQNRFGERLASFNESLEREGPFFLFTLRLIPAVPFFVINAVMGLTPMRPRTFWWVSQIGMLPGTAVYVYAGSSVPNLQKLADEGINSVFEPAQLFRILVAFALLGVFPLIIRFAMKLLGKSESKADDSPASIVDSADS